MVSLNVEKFANLAKSKIVDIIKQERTDLLSIKEFKILHSLLNKFWNDRPNKSSLFTIIIDEYNIKNLNIPNIIDNLKTIITESLCVYNEIYVDNSFRIVKEEYVKYKDRNEVNRHFTELSENGYCVFFFGSEGVDIYVKGVHQLKVNIFYTPEDLLRFRERYHISDIKSIFELYQNRYLTKQYVYATFFAEKSTLARIDQSLTDRNILRNKPEKFMRDHLLDFLNNNTQHKFYKESELIASKRETDIYTEVDGELYLFEVKWLGRCISDCGTKITSLNTHAYARDGVKQTLEYMYELIEIMNHTLKCAYLIVFDARYQRTPLDYRNYEFIEDKLKKYLPIFKRIDNLTLDNRHPS